MRTFHAHPRKRWKMQGKRQLPLRLGADDGASCQSRYRRPAAQQGSEDRTLNPPGSPIDPLLLLRRRGQYDRSPGSAGEGRNEYTFQSRLGLRTLQHDQIRQALWRSDFLLRAGPERDVQREKLAEDPALQSNPSPGGQDPGLARKAYGLKTTPGGVTDCTRPCEGRGEGSIPSWETNRPRGVVDASPVSTWKGPVRPRAGVPFLGIRSRMRWGWQRSQRLATASPLTCGR